MTCQTPINYSIELSAVEMITCKSVAMLKRNNIVRHIRTSI